jgi:dihydropteroate synthase
MRTLSDTLKNFSTVAPTPSTSAASRDLVNDVTAASADGMLELVARFNAGIVFMHMRGKPRTMQSDTSYDNVVAEVHEHLRCRAAAAIAAGIPAHRVWLDPGIGFGKDDDGNLALLAALPDLAAVGHPVLIGPSNKSFIGRLTGAEVEDRLPGTLAALLPAVGIDRAVVRVHDASAAVQFLEIASRLHEASA